MIEGKSRGYDPTLEVNHFEDDKSNCRVNDEDDELESSS
jgi:hypothetical protein